MDKSQIATQSDREKITCICGYTYYDFIGRENYSHCPDCDLPFKRSLREKYWQEINSTVSTFVDKKEEQ